LNSQSSINSSQGISRLKNGYGMIIGDGIEDDEIPEFIMKRPHGSLDLKRLRAKISRNRI
jgi:hypothetical protein